MIASAFGALSRWVLERALPRKRARAERPDPARDDVDDDDVEDSSHAPKKQKITVARAHTGAKATTSAKSEDARFDAPRETRDDADASKTRRTRTITVPRDAVDADASKPRKKQNKKAVPRAKVRERDEVEVELPDDVWRTICELVCDVVDEDRKFTKNRKGEAVDRRKVVYKARLETLCAMRRTNEQLRRVLNSDFGELLFRRGFENLGEVLETSHGVDVAPMGMAWRHKAWLLMTLGCQACENHPTMRKPNWVFGVRMCKECQRERTLTERELRGEEWSKHATYEELTSGLPHDEIQGYSRFIGEWTMTRYWTKSVETRVELLKRAENPAARAQICAAPEEKPAEHRIEERARERREQELKIELDLLGCEIRNDSKLCKLFIDGFPKHPRDRAKWTAKEVAKRMAQMKYLHEYCRAFREEIQEWRDEINELHNENVWGVTHREITYEVTGFYRFGDAVRDLTDSWTDFPEQWPWLVRTR